MLSSGLISTVLLGACLLMTAGFTRAELSFPSIITATSTGRVITFNSFSVQHLICESGVIIVQSVLHRCADQDTCSRLPNLDVIKNSCDLKEVCEIQTNIICACNSSICKYLDITYSCFPANRTVACEGSQANLQCGEGQVIVVYWADYGRRDRTTCSDGRPDSQLQNVQCFSPNSTEYVANSCNLQNNCTVEAKSSVFGDPCGGTSKYLEVVYGCQVLPASCFLITSAVNVTSIYNVTPISKGRVITFASLSVHRLSCERGVITVESAQNGTLDIIKRSCDGKKVCDINTNITSDPGICNFLDTTYSCFPANRTVACEGSQANLQCGEGQVIVVYWADYGRRDRTTCSDGRPDSQPQNVQCFSPSSTEYVANSCNWQNNCTVEAKNSVFGDPCVNTSKYLEVVYDCQAVCPPGWTWFGGRCFIFQSSEKSWSDAESSCQTLGGNLTSFHSTAEYTFIRVLIHRAAGSDKNSWVGGWKKGTVWMWRDGSKFDFPHWASREPSNYANENCMEINHDGKDYVNDAPCDPLKPSVCVRDP